MKLFYHLLVNSFIASSSTMLVWFALSLWVYTKTDSVLANSIMSGIFLIASAATGIWFGSLVDHHKKKTMMIISNVISASTFIAAFIMYITFPESAFTSHSSLSLWLFVSVIFVGVIVANIRGIALPTMITLLVDEKGRDKANGLAGTSNGLTFLVASIISGFLLASSGMYWILLLTIVLLVLSSWHLLFIQIPEKKIVHIQPEQEVKKFDMMQTFQLIKKVPGLFPLILFTCFNNFLGGIFMPLMDPYGLSLVSLQAWGVIWGFLSLGFILGGLFIAQKGLGKNPVKTLLTVDLVLWVVCMFFTIQPSIVLVTIGCFIYICLVPFIEASEHTIIQKIVPPERQGRVFGFAQSIEQSASPLTALAIGPLTQFIFIPFMTTGKGVELIGGWFGVGEGRGIALVFTLAGAMGVIMTIFALRSKSYRLLSESYLKS